MKITASKRDDIIKQRDQFDAEAKARNDATEAEVKRWRDAQNAVFKEVEEALRAKIPQTSLAIDIHVRNSWIGSGNGIEVSLGNKNNNPHAQGNALSWEWSVKLNRQGEVVKESNSWSGLKATTVEELQSLEDSLTVLKAINNFDWKTILSRALPEWGDYVQDRGPRPERPDFEGQLKEAEIEELVGTDTLVVGVAGEGSGYRLGIEVYYLIHKESPKQYVVSCSAKSFVNEWIADGKSKEEILKEIGRYEFRINKSKFFQLIGKEVETLEL